MCIRGTVNLCERIKWMKLFVDEGSREKSTNSIAFLSTLLPRPKIMKSSGNFLWYLLYINFCFSTEKCWLIKEMPVVQTDYDGQLFRPIGQGQLPLNLKICEPSSLSVPRNRNPNIMSNQFPRKKLPYGKNDGPKDSQVTETRFGILIFRTTLLILLYYISSIGLTFYQKWLLKVGC